MNESSNNIENENLEEIFQRKDIANFYFNGFMVGASHDDIFIILSRNGNLDCILNTSHTTAKGMMEALQNALKDIETRGKK